MNNKKNEISFKVKLDNVYHFGGTFLCALAALAVIYYYVAIFSGRVPIFNIAIAVGQTLTIVVILMQLHCRKLSLTPRTITISTCGFETLELSHKDVREVTLSHDISKLKIILHDGASKSYSIVKNSNTITDFEFVQWNIKVVQSSKSKRRNLQKRDENTN